MLAEPATAAPHLPVWWWRPSRLWLIWRDGCYPSLEGRQSRSWLHARGVGLMARPCGHWAPLGSSPVLSAPWWWIPCGHWFRISRRVSANKPVFACASGSVIYAGAAPGYGGPDSAGWLVIDHPAEVGGGCTEYGHIMQGCPWRSRDSWTMCCARSGRRSPRRTPRSRPSPRCSLWMRLSRAWVEVSNVRAGDGAAIRRTWLTSSDTMLAWPTVAVHLTTTGLSCGSCATVLPPNPKFCNEWASHVR